jgi:putative acetyltransferase
MARIEVRSEPLDSPIAGRLIAELNAELSVDYAPEERFHDLPAEDVAEGAGRFVVAWLDGVPAGCGAVRLLSPDRAELKRMYVVADHRGHGLSRAILSTLEEVATTLGAKSVVLETGIYQPPAIGLYESSGYTRIPRFGPYAASATSLCYEKSLIDEERGEKGPHMGQNSPRPA